MGTLVLFCGSVKWYNCFGKQFWQLSSKVENTNAYNTVTSLIGVYSWKTHVHVYKKLVIEKMCGKQ